MTGTCLQCRSRRQTSTHWNAAVRPWRMATWRRRLPHSLTETSFQRLFRLAQLTVEYLLHIQDRLVWENGLLKVTFSPTFGRAECSVL